MTLKAELVAQVQAGLDSGESISQVAAKAGVSRPTIYKWIKLGKIAAAPGQVPKAAAPPPPPEPPTVVPLEAFGQALAKLRPQLENWTTRVCGSRAMAEDIVSTAFINALQARASFQAGSNFTAWMFRIVRNLIFSDSKQRTSRKTTTLPERSWENFSSPERTSSTTLSHEVIVLIVTKLGWAYRDTLLAICYEGAGYEETAKRYGVSVGTIKSRLWRARAQIKQLLNGAP